MAASSISLISILTQTSASAKSRVVNTISVYVTNVFLSAIRLNFYAVDTVSVIARTTNTLITINVAIELTVCERVTVVDDIA